MHLCLFANSSATGYADKVDRLMTCEQMNNNFFDSVQPFNTGQNFFELQPGFIVNISSAIDMGVAQTSISMPGDKEYIHLNYLLKGRFLATVKDVCIDCYAGDISMGFSDGEVFQSTHCADFINLEIMVKPHLLNEFAGEQLAGINFDKDIQFFIKNGVSCSRVKAAAYRVVSVIKQQVKHPLLLKSATLEYLYWHLMALKKNKFKEHFSAREKKQLSFAKECLLNDLSSAPTIAELSKTVGLNQCKLKRGFKISFGKSIYATFQEERMNKAMNLLKNNNVTETAIILGYSNFSHFSNAFRKQFGRLPKEARRELEPDF